MRGLVVFRKYRAAFLHEQGTERIIAKLGFFRGYVLPYIPSLSFHFLRILSTVLLRVHGEAFM